MGESVEGFDKELKSAIETAKPALDIISKAIQAIEKIGEYQSISPLFSLLSKAEGPKDRVLPSVGLLLKQFEIWCETQAMPDMKEQTEKLLSTINTKIGTSVYRLIGPSTQA